MWTRLDEYDFDGLIHSLLLHKNLSMAKKQNPYQLWLGVNPKFTNPNLFQLLGVDPRSQDESAIKRKAVASAKVLLQKLKTVEAKNDAEKVFKRKLHAKIVLAHETMIAPDKREKYLNALNANAAAQKKGAKTPGPDSTNATELNQAASNSPKTPVPSTMPSLEPVSPTAGNPSPIPPVEIPSAIPMAMPVSIPPAATNNNEHVTTFSLVDHLAEQAAPNFDNLDAGPQIKVYAKKRKTSRSWVVPLVVLTLLVGGVGGLVSLMTKYSNIFELIPALNEKVNAVAVEPNATKGEGANGDDLKSASLTVPKAPHYAIDYKGNEKPDMETPEGGVPLLVKPNNEAGVTKPTAKPAMNSKSAVSSKAEEERSGALDARTRKPSKTDTGDASQENRTLVESQLNSIRMGLHRSRAALSRQDRELARHLNGVVKKLHKRFNITRPEAVTREHQGLVRAAEINDQVIGWVDDFWKQVKSAANEMEGGDAITLGDKTMSLVEATDEDIVLRVAGQNERIKYSHLTPLLATKLGEMGAKESVPRWNLAQAAFLGVMSEQYGHLKQKQFGILNQLKNDGYDAESEAISDFTAPDWLKLGLPKKKMSPLSDDQFNDLIAISRAQIGYQDPSSVTNGQVLPFLYRLLILNPSKDSATRVARLWEAIAIMIKGRRIEDLVLVNRELNNCCTEVDFNKSFADPVLTTVKGTKDPNLKDLIARQTIKFVKLFDGNPNLTPPVRKKLVQSVSGIAKDLESTQLAAMAQQLSASK